MRLVTAVVTLALALAGSSARAASSCVDLKKLPLGDATITQAESVPAGSFTARGRGPGAGAVTVPFCRVQGVITPTSDSHIEFEVWLPATGWNGRYEGIGNGGFAGGVGYTDLAMAVKGGYAASATDTGHRAEGPAIDARWDGNTLVVDVVNFVDSTWFGEDGFFHSDAMQVTERFWRSGANLVYQVTVDDPKVLASPWTMAPRVVKPSTEPLEESPKCTEADSKLLVNNDHHGQR